MPLRPEVGNETITRETVFEEDLRWNSLRKLDSLGILKAAARSCRALPAR